MGRKGRKSVLTQELVDEACNDALKTGIKPTIQGVRAVFGTGSVKTIAPLLANWKSRNMAETWIALNPENLSQLRQKTAERLAALGAPLSPKLNPSPITEESVAQACENIVNAGGNPTIRGVREQLGGRSLNTIGPYIKIWRLKGEQDRAERLEDQLKRAQGEIDALRYALSVLGAQGAQGAQR
jgi:hypothetical protein